MPGKISRIRFLALLLGIVFLAAQFHFCADLTSDPYSLHICPFCSVAGSAILMRPPSIAIMPIVSRLERTAVVFDVFYAVPCATSPRAPPSA
jgi:hypothetical protein